MARSQTQCTSLECTLGPCLVMLHKQGGVGLLGVQNQGCSEVPRCEMGERHQKHLRCTLGLNVIFCFCSLHIQDHIRSGNPQGANGDAQGEKPDFKGGRKDVCQK